MGCIVLFNACKKNEQRPPVKTEPTVSYINLSDTSIPFNGYASFDLNKDGQKDVAFGTQMVGDVINKQDKKQWLVITSFYSSLPVNESEQIPMMNLFDTVAVANFSGYNWYNASSILLVQKVITSETNFWEGDWKNASHRFVPLQVAKGNTLYNGWVEISFSQAAEKMILHKAAISNEANREVVIKY